jgi:hypothetical protein
MSTTNRHADGVFIVFDHDHAVAQIAQALEGAEQAVVVALVQADGRLVEHIHHAGEASCRFGWPGGCAGLRRPIRCRRAV